MNKVAIVTDSSAYLPQKYVEQYGLRVIPLTLHWEGASYRDGVDIQAGEFYTRLEKASSLPTTSQIPISDFEVVFRELLDKGFDVLSLGISGGISGSVQSAYQARDMFPAGRIIVHETKLVSMALSFQVLTVARAAQEGAGLEECLRVAEEAYNHIGVYFTVDTLKYLAAGGRIGSAKRLLGTALSIKPVLQIRDGKIELVESVISKRKAVERMVNLVERDIAGRSPVRISVFHANLPDIAQELQDRLVKQFNAVEAILSEVSPVVGSHVGPGTISVAYMAGM